MAFFLLALCVFTALYYGNAGSIAAQADNTMLRRHKQADEYVKGVEQMVMSCYYQLATDTYIENWVQEAYRPKIDYYDMYLTYRQLNTVIGSHPLVESIYLRTFGNDMVLSTSFMFDNLDDFPLRSLFYGAGQGWLPARWERESGANARRILPLRLPVTLSVPNGDIVINVSESILMYSLPEACDGVLLLGENREVLTASAPDLREAYLAWQEGADEQAGDEIARVGDYYMILSSQPGIYWYTVTFFDAGPIDAEKEAGLRLPRIILVILGAAVVICAILLVITRYLQKKQQELAGASLAQSRYARESEQIRQLFCDEGGDLQLPKSLRGRDVSILDRGYRVVAYAIDGYYRRFDSREGKPDGEVGLLTGVLRTIIQSRWEGCAGGKGAPPIVQRTEPDKLAAIYFSPLEQGELTAMLRIVRSDIAENFPCPVRILVSDEAKGPQRVHPSYVQCVQLLIQKSALPAKDILFYGDMPAHDAEARQFPLEELHRICAAISLGTGGDLSELDAMLERLCEKCQNSAYMLNAAMSNIIFELIKQGRAAGVTPDKLDEAFVRLYNLDEIAEKRELIKQLCAQSASMRGRAHSFSDNLLAQRIDSYIQEHYDKEISLAVLADEFQLGASYISTLIKRELGLNFNNYINQLRVKKSVNLLKSTYFSVREVAGNCGYDDVHTYIRNFKKIYMTTPAEYRKKLWEQQQG